MSETQLQLVGAMEYVMAVGGTLGLSVEFIHTINNGLIVYLCARNTRTVGS